MVLHLFQKFYNWTHYFFTHFYGSLINIFKINKISTNVKNNSIHDYLRTLATIYNEKNIRELPLIYDP
ncbi:MAG: hypothetical protein ABI045_05280 [Flavobacteriales bacterium]